MRKKIIGGMPPVGDKFWVPFMVGKGLDGPFRLPQESMREGKTE